jgi:DNA-binding response OmpR family regulator
MVLVVEDDVAVLQLICRVLAASGYAVLPARNGEIGLRAFTAHAESIAVVIADVVVPA